MAQVLTHNDETILNAIRAIRRRNRCCSLLPLATASGFSRDFVMTRLSILQASGVVDWRNKVVGSIHIVAESDDHAVEVAQSLSEDDLLAMAAAALQGETITSPDAADARSDESLPSHQPAT